MVPARFVVSVFVFVSVSVSVAPLVFRAPSDPAVGPGCWLCPWAAARPRAVRAASLRLGASSRSPARPRHRPRAPQPGPPLPPAPSTLAAPGVLACGPARTRRHSRALQPGPVRSSPVRSGPSGALRAGGTCGSGVPGQAPPPLTGAAARPRLEARPCPPVPSVPFAPAGLWFWCARPGPAATHGHGSQARFEARPCAPVPPAPFAPVVPVVLVCPARPRRHSRASPLMLTNFARNSPTTVSNLECASLELQRFQRLLKLPSNELRATFLEPAVSYVLHQRIQECSVFRGPTVPRGCAWFGHSWGVRTSL